ncbi:IspD/TarI family cytidylyltransferase [Treponema sp.]
MEAPHAEASQSIAVIITAAGSSTRMGGVKKEYRLLGKDLVDASGKALTVLGAAASAFALCPHIDTIVITVPQNGEDEARKSLPVSLIGSDKKPLILFVAGGATRRRSVHQALSLLSLYKPSYVLIHDGARPWLDADLVNRTIEAVRVQKAVIPCLPLVETPKEIDKNGLITRHLPRSSIVSAQTPQAFSFKEILEAHELAAEEELQKGTEYTDDAEVWGCFIGRVAVIPGSLANKKITFLEDLS